VTEDEEGRAATEDLKDNEDAEAGGSASKSK
jgi:hypothetical protein